MKHVFEKNMNIPNIGAISEHPVREVLQLYLRNLAKDNSQIKHIPPPYLMLTLPPSATNLYLLDHLEMCEMIICKVTV